MSRQLFTQKFIKSTVTEKKITTDHCTAVNKSRDYVPNNRAILNVTLDS